MRDAADPCLFRCAFSVCVIFALFSIRSLALPADKARGIAPADLKYYQGASIWCKDKSKTFPLSRLNDNYCDCPDGTDEPGTSACPESRFYCKNTGHTPQFLFSSRVNDGICDCCDGSDEYNGKTTCSDVCWESGKKSREKLEKKVSVYKEGAKVRAKDIRHYKHSRKEQEGELVSLKKEEKRLKEITQKLKVELEAVEEAERLEREKKAKQEEERKSKEANDTTTSDEIEKDSEVIENLPEEVQTPENEVDNQEALKEEDLTEAEKESAEDMETKTVAQTEKHLEVEPQHEPLESHTDDMHSDSDPEEMDGLSKEEVGRRVASRWTGGSSKSEDTVEESADGSKSGDLDDTYPEEYLKGSHEDDEDEEDDNYDSYVDEKKTYTDTSINEASSWWQKLRQAPRVLLTLLGLKRMHVDASEADRIRSEYRQATSKLNDLQSKISELENKLKQDFGKEGEFFSLYDQCFERRQQKYVYKVCIYKDSLQEEGHTSTRLGYVLRRLSPKMHVCRSWEGFLDDYKSMKFQNGEHCWNGPQRSLKVKLRCGLKSELSDIEEPSRCEYSASFWTTAVCSEEKAKELEAELDALRAGAVATGHEEL